MRTQFLGRALLPHLLLTLAVLGLCQFAKSVEAAAGLAVLVTAAQLLGWYGTDLLVTGRARGERMIRESKTYIGPDGRPTKDPELQAWFLLGVLFYFISWAVLGASPSFSLPAACLFLVIDVGLLLVALAWGDAYGAFARHVWPRLEGERLERARRRQGDDAEARRRGEVQAARILAEQYYAAHKDVLGAAFPQELFRTSLNAAVPMDDAGPAHAWQAARDLIDKLRPLVAQALEVREREEQRHRQADQAVLQTQQEIGALQARIDALAGRADDDALEEMVELQRQLARLQGRPLRRTVAPDDL